MNSALTERGEGKGVYGIEFLHIASINVGFDFVTHGFNQGIPDMIRRALFDKEDNELCNE